MIQIPIRNEVFLDTSFAVALASATDALHPTALALEQTIRLQSARIVTTEAVLIEIGDTLSSERQRPVAVRTIRLLRRDANVVVVPFSTSLFDESFELFAARSDKDWGLTDCVSFVVMQERGLTDALTADRHFIQAGFRALLLEESG